MVPMFLVTLGGGDRKLAVELVTAGHKFRG
jgi:hypothetical protein